MSRTEERRQWLKQCMAFVVGDTEEKPDAIANYIDARSRVVELREMRYYHAVVKGNYKKEEFITFFCDLQAFERKKLVAEMPEMIIALPNDCKTLRIERPSRIAFRNASFGGKSVEYEVFAIADILIKTKDLHGKKIPH